MKRLGLRAAVAVLPLLLALDPAGHAQPIQPPTPAEAEAALNPAPAPLSDAQLDQLVAPIALYPDQLLTQVLMAATSPDQLVEAQKWLEDSSNAALKGDDLANALLPLPWDPSVKSLVAFPQIVAMMTAHLDWTQALGAAFANQEVQVFARVQYLRQRAEDAGTLQSNTQIAVTTQASDIVIEPANPDTVYVPVYNPADVYGQWPDSAYPPVYIPPPPGFYNGALGAGIAFSVGFGVIAPLWGWGHPDWHNHSVAIDPGRYQHITTQNYITQNHITIENGAWHRGGPVAMVPEAQRPHPSYQGGEPPRGTVAPSAVVHPGGPGPRPAGGPGPRPAGEAQPGPRPAGEAGPGPRPAGEPGRPEENRPGGPPHPEEHAAPQEEHGPPPGQPQRPPENHGPPPQASHPQGPPPQAPHPQGPPPQAPHPQGPPPQQHPGGPAKPAPKPGEEHKDEQH